MLFEALGFDMVQKIGVKYTLVTYYGNLELWIICQKFLEMFWNHHIKLLHDKPGFLVSTKFFIQKLLSI